METVIKFYVDIEFAGSSMFYSKFQYRHDCSTIFQRFWISEAYRAKVREIKDTPHFEKFMNSLINDLTFCFEEGLAKIQAINDFEVKQEANPKLVTKEDKANYKQNKQICRANFQLAGECLWNTKQISTWCKQAFLNEAFAGRIAQTMNFVLK